MWIYLLKSFEQFQYWFRSQIVLSSDLRGGCCSARQIKFHFIPVLVLGGFWVYYIQVIHHEVGHLGSAEAPFTNMD